MDLVLYIIIKRGQGGRGSKIQKKLRMSLMDGPFPGREGEAAKKSEAVFDILCGHLLGAFSFQTASEKASERKRPIRKNARTRTRTRMEGSASDAAAKGHDSETVIFLPHFQQTPTIFHFKLKSSHIHNWERGLLAGESCNIREASLARSLVPSFDLDGASNGAEGETDREVEGEGGEERKGGRKGSGHGQRRRRRRRRH